MLTHGWARAGKVGEEARDEILALRTESSLVVAAQREGRPLCFFVHEVVERLDLEPFEEAYGEEGRRAHAPALMVKVWLLYAYALQVTSSRRLEQRVREDRAFRYLAGGATPDHWTLNDFRTRHAEALNDLFVQVVEVARGWVWPSWGTWRSTRRGMRRFRLRGRKKVAVELALACTAFNLTRMWRRSARA